MKDTFPEPSPETIPITTPIKWQYEYFNDPNEAQTCLDNYSQKFKSFLQKNITENMFTELLIICGELSDGRERFNLFISKFRESRSLDLIINFIIQRVVVNYINMLRRSEPDSKIPTSDLIAFMETYISKLTGRLSTAHPLDDNSVKQPIEPDVDLKKWVARFTRSS